MTKTQNKAVELNEAEQLYASAATGRDASDTAWMDDLRKSAQAAFSTQGLPHRRVEAFKFTDIRAFDRKGFAQTERADRVRGDIAPLYEGMDEILVLNGEVVASDLVEGRFGEIKVLSLETALTQETELLEEALWRELLAPNPLADLNMSLMNSGVVIIVPDDVVQSRPIHIRYINDAAGSSAFVRNVVVVGDGGRVTVIESRLKESATGTLLNSVTTLRLGKDSRARHYRFDECDDESLSLMLLDSELAGRAKLEAGALSLGGKVARIETQVRLAGEEAHVDLRGVLLGQGRDHIDHTTYVSHAVPNCTCDENYRSILTDNAQGVFQGQISVAPQAQKTDSRMLTRALLLSDTASMRAKPELEIYADDVKCAHGASVGNLDQEAVFYMMSRGIPESEARALLVKAFSKDVIEGIGDEGMQNEFERRLASKLAFMV